MSCGYISKRGQNSFMYFALTFEQLFHLYKWVLPHSRHLNTMVLNNAPCHQFFDLDCSIKQHNEDIALSQRVDTFESIKDKTDDIIAEWFQYWSAFFVEEVGKRQIDLRVTQVEIASCEGKFSIHIHVVSEAFVNVDHHKTTVVRFVEWLKENAPESLLLLVLDVSVYTQNRNMRLIGSCKPGKQTLAIYDYKNKQVLPLDAITEKHVFNGLISYALTLSPGQQPVALELHNALQQQSQGRKRKTDSHNQDHHPTARTVKHQRVTQHDSRRDEIAEAVQQYGFEINGEMNTDGFFECVQPPEGRFCFLLNDAGERIKHKRNRAKCWVTSAGVWIGCHSGQCIGKKQLQDLLPQSNGKQNETNSALEEPQGAEEEETKVQGGDDGGEEEKKEQAGEQPTVAQTQDDRPELSKMMQIHAEWTQQNQGSLTTAVTQSESTNARTAKKAEDQLAKLRSALYLALVRYLNKYLMAIVRGGKATILGEIITLNRRTMRFGYQHSIWSVNDFKQVHLNWKLPGIPTPITLIWLTHPMRRQVDNIVFRPQPDNFVDTSRFHDFNMYKGAGISRAEAADWAQKNPDWEQQFEPLLHHIQTIWCSDLPELISYVMGWMAHVVQKPHEKTGAGLVLKSEEGAGKTVVVDKLGSIVGTEHYFPVHDPQDVLGKYTHQLKACILLSMDEALWGGDKANAEVLKKIITQPTHSIHEKYLSSITVESYVNVMFSTNNDWAAPASRTDRRLMCIEVSNRYAGIQTTETRAYFDKIRAVPNEAFAHYLYTYDLSNFNPREIVATDLQRDQKMRSFEPLYKWWHAQTG